MLRLVPLFLLLLGLIGCSSGGGSQASGSSATLPALTSNNGRWQSTQTLVKTEWTFHEDGTYDALHQEGTVAATIRGTYKLDGSHFTATPNTDSVDAKSGSNPEEAEKIKARLEKGYDLTLNPTEGGFTGAPADGSGPMNSSRCKGRDRGVFDAPQS